MDYLVMPLDEVLENMNGNASSGELNKTTRVFAKIARMFGYPSSNFSRVHVLLTDEVDAFDPANFGKCEVHTNGICSYFNNLVITYSPPDMIKGIYFADEHSAESYAQQIDSFYEDNPPYIDYYRLNSVGNMVTNRGAVPQFITEDPEWLDEFVKQFYGAEYHDDTPIYEGAKMKLRKLTLKEDLDEALHGFDEIELFTKMANQAGIRTLGDYKRFKEEHPDDTDEFNQMLTYRASLGNDFKIADPEEDAKYSFTEDYDDTYCVPQTDNKSGELVAVLIDWLNEHPDQKSCFCEFASKRGVDTALFGECDVSETDSTPSNSVLAELKNIKFVDNTAVESNGVPSRNEISDLADPAVVYDDEI